MLAGSVSLPDGARAAPGLVMIGGSGPSDRHSDGFFDVLAGHLVREGVAVLRYDKRGVGGSQGRWASGSVEQLAADAAGAVAALRAHAGVDGERVGVLGHSEGAWVAMRLGAGATAPAHLILNSGSAVGFIECEVHALVAAGVPPEHARAGGRLLNEMAAAARGGETLAQGRAMLAALACELSLPPALLDDFELNEDRWLQLAAWGAYEPQADLRALHVPTLALLGDEDPLVPAACSVERYRSSEVVEVRVFPGVGHRLQTPDGTLAPGYLDALSERCNSF